MEFKNDLEAGFIALPLPVASGSVDYRAYELLLRKIDQILVQSGAEAALQRQAVEMDEQIPNPLKRASSTRLSGMHLMPCDATLHGAYHKKAIVSSPFIWLTPSS
jgi:hypothetical protein